LAVIAFLLSLVSFIRTASMALVNIGASNQLHGGALKSVLHAPTSFFDVTPIGRIISRFSKDLHTMDGELGKATLEINTFLLFHYLLLLFSIDSGLIIFIFILS
jgi:ABC-type multidrug transport system fused ATPase/permease subunit